MSTTETNKENWEETQWDIMDPYYEAKKYKEKCKGKRPAIVRPAIRKQLPIKKWSTAAKNFWYRKQLQTAFALMQSGIYDGGLHYLVEDMMLNLIRPIAYWKVFFLGIFKPISNKFFRYIRWYLYSRPQEIFRFGWHYWGVLAAIEEEKEWSRRMDETPLDKMSDGDLESKLDRCKTIKEGAAIDQTNTDDEKVIDHLQLVIKEQSGLMLQVTQEMARRRKMKQAEEMEKHAIKEAKKNEWTSESELISAQIGADLPPKEAVFSRHTIEQLQHEVHKITGDGDVMKLFNQLLGEADNGQQV